MTGADLKVGGLFIYDRWRSDRDAQLDNLMCKSVARTHEELERRSRHRFLEPIHNVKEGRHAPYRERTRGFLVFIPGKSWPAQKAAWWSLSGSNR